MNIVQDANTTKERSMISFVVVTMIKTTKVHLSHGINCARVLDIKRCVHFVIKKRCKFSKYKPIKIHHILYGYGWWFGKTFFFFKGGLVIVPIYAECGNAIYAKSGKLICPSPVPRFPYLCR